jgi:hypothetical protein
MAAARNTTRRALPELAFPPMVVLIELVLIGLLVALLLLGGWAAWRALQSPGIEGGRRALPARQRAEVAAAVARARWVPGHDEMDGTTRVLLRRTYTGLDGLPAVLEERVLQSFPADDPAWEARFTEGMAAARFRCAYLNSEEDQE